MQDVQPVIELLRLLITDPRMVLLICLLIGAAVIDYKTYRIPNWLTLSGTTFALVYSIFVPFSPQTGFLWALAGFAVGFVVMVPMYAFRVMGAGDVKLMAMAGAFLGFDATLHAVILTLITGGILAIAFSAYRGVAGRMLANVKDITTFAAVSMLGGMRLNLRTSTTESAGRLPYGVSICIGTISSVLLRQLGYL